MEELNSSPAMDTGQKPSLGLEMAQHYSLLRQCPSEGIRQVADLVDRVSTGDIEDDSSTVLLTGETGVGKEIVARAIFEQSESNRRVFVPVNCGNQNRDLMGSEFFGHEKGAFTGSIGVHKGFFETADGGTLFLDEIGDLPLEFQSRLLKALDDRVFNRVGGTASITSSFRLIAATNQNLPEMVTNRQFRADLYYRLNVFPIKIPPLRERALDVSHLSKLFTKRYSAGRTVLDESAESKLETHYWPGNVRELKHVIKRAVIMANGSGRIMPSHIDFESDRMLRRIDDMNSASLDQVLTRFMDLTEDRTYWERIGLLERHIIENSLFATSGNAAQAAKMTGVARSLFYNKMKEHGFS